MGWIMWECSSVPVIGGIVVNGSSDDVGDTVGFATRNW